MDIKKKWQKKICYVLLYIIVLCVCVGVHMHKRQEVPVSTYATETRQLPIIMYHSIVDSTAKAGDYVITPVVLEADFAYISAQGYEAVSIDELIAFGQGTGTLPQKPILITFDDGHYNNYSYALPLLQKYDLKAVISVVGAFTDFYSELGETPNNNYSCLTWAQIKELIESERIDIGNHSNNLHDPQKRLGIIKASGETDAQFLQMVYNDLQSLQDKMAQEIGYTPKVLAYPFGKFSQLTEDLAKDMGFLVTLTCAERINVITKGDAQSLYGLGRYNRPYGVSTQAFMQRIES